MNLRFEFMLRHVSVGATTGETDPALSLLGAQGWEIRGISSTSGGRVVVALQRPLEGDKALPDAPALAAALAEPLVAPTPTELDVGEHG